MELDEIGLDRISAFQIRGKRTRVETYQDRNTQKWGFVISAIGVPAHYRAIGQLAEAEAVYDSEREACTAGRDLVNEVKKMSDNKILEL